MNSENSGIARIVRGLSVIDGAGVRLHRIIGSPRLNHVDPFVLLDEFKSDNPKDYIAGFPDHPHRGIETITYMITGNFRHKDSRGGGGLLSAGCVQWMTAGRGIIHSEMPEMKDGQLWGYQLWLTLAARDKMIEPRYQHLNPEDIPVLKTNRLTVKLISGSYQGTSGPALTQFPVSYFDIALKKDGLFQLPRSEEENSFLYVHSGSVSVEVSDQPQQVSAGELALLAKAAKPGGPAGNAQVSVRGMENESGFLYFSAIPHNEPIVRGGPFVMNSEEEIRQAFLDYQTGKLF
ncbi:MAG: pirin family protein [Spirochaetaceae bacterium]|nr:MAG: pirin family protein [Spirochaetaceae bacterium]